MSYLRVIVAQGKTRYRFMRIVPNSDGSIQIIIDRDTRSDRRLGAMSFHPVYGFTKVDTSLEKPNEPTRFSIHTSGEIHRHTGGVRKQTIFIEPLPNLTSPHDIGIVSVPKPSKLSLLEEKHLSPDGLVIIECPLGFDDRMTFLLRVGPRDAVHDVPGISINYELYALSIHQCDLEREFTENMKDRFIYGMPQEGMFLSRQIDKANAELLFFKKANPDTPQVYREDGGSYIVFSSTPMRAAPELVVEFDRDGLRAQQIAYSGERPPSHKARFWICDRGGRNKTEDLRKHIVSIFLQSEL